MARPRSQQAVRDLIFNVAAGLAAAVAIMAAVIMADTAARAMARHPDPTYIQTQAGGGSCFPVDQVLAEFKKQPEVESVQKFSAAETQQIVAAIEAEAGQKLDIDTVAVVWGRDGRAIIFVGTGGMLCRYRMFPAPALRAFLKQALGA